MSIVVVWYEKFEHKLKHRAIASNWKKGKLQCWFPFTFILFILAVVELCNDIIFHGRFLNITTAKWRNDLNRTDNIPCCYKNLLEPT